MSYYPCILNVEIAVNALQISVYGYFMLLISTTIG
jgi:hypothetical protein